MLTRRVDELRERVALLEGAVAHLLSELEAVRERLRLLEGETTHTTSAEARGADTRRRSGGDLTPAAGASGQAAPADELAEQRELQRLRRREIDRLYPRGSRS